MSSNYEFKIVRAEVLTFAPIPIEKAFYDGTHGPHLDMPIKKWIKLYDEDGVCGEGPCSDIMEKSILPIVFECDKISYEELYKKIYWKIRNNGFSGETYTELGKLDLVLYDIMSKKAKMPLHKFLGATKNNIKLYASGCSTKLTEKELVQHAERYVAEGYDTIKMKIATDFGSTVERDISRVKLVRDAVGSKIKIAIDANQCWNSEEAYKFLQSVQEYDIAWFEEPVHSHDFEEIQKMCSMSKIDIAFGESVKNAYMFKQYSNCGVKHLQPVWSNMGGLREVFKTDKIALENSLTLSLGGITHITAALSAACVSNTITEYLEPLFRPLEYITNVKPEIKDGYMILPEKHGVPVSLNMEYLVKNQYLLKQEYYYSK
jgi:L-alanine-DL-glutamate epimerase-like enolase superfamily enzyme